ncbi:MAG: hypothetical protein RIQ53_3771 [Pseudomonadota bacterium]|jgi:hypothetical protein
MRLTLKPLPLLIALSLTAGCGGGGDTPVGTTVSTQSASSGSLLACIDANTNGHCDDGDASRLLDSLPATGATGLSPTSSQRVLLERRDSANRRTGLWLAETGSAQVSALSSLRAALAAQGRSATTIDTLVTALGTRHGSALESTLAASLATAQQQQGLAWQALLAWSGAVATAGDGAATLTAASSTLAAPATATQWDASADGSARRQLTAYGSQVLNNSESNRLYLFDASAETVSSREIDLVPAQRVALADQPPLLRRAWAMVEGAVSLFVDTASAATGFTTTPRQEEVVTLAPGLGITGITLVNAAQDAFVLLNMADGGHTGSSCETTSQGREGLFRVGLGDTASYRWLAQAPACVHSGFSLLAADAAGSRVAAWDATGAALWVMDGSTLALQRRIDPGLSGSTAVQAMGISAGGRFVALAAYGRLTLVDLSDGRLVAQLTGDWGNVTQVAFAQGGRRVLLASAQSVHTLVLDDQMQRLSASSVTVGSSSDEPVRALAVAADGDSYFAVTDQRIAWRAAATDSALASRSLDAGMSVQQATLAGTRLVLLARGAQDQQLRLMRLSTPLNATVGTTVSTTQATTNATTATPATAARTGA